MRIIGKIFIYIVITAISFVTIIALKGHKPVEAFLNKILETPGQQPTVSEKEVQSSTRPTTRPDQTIGEIKYVTPERDQVWVIFDEPIESFNPENAFGAPWKYQPNETERMYNKTVYVYKKK